MKAYDETKAIPVMFIVLPLSCYCPPNLDNDFRFVEHIHKKSTRAGNIERDYKSPVYEFEHNGVSCASVLTRSI